MPNINTVTLAGHLGRDPETKFTAGGTGKMSFSMATSRRWKDNASGEYRDETDWHNIIVWKPSDHLTNALHKGSAVMVTGRISTRSYEAKDGSKRYVTEIVADKVWPLDPKQSTGGRPGPQAVPAPARRADEFTVTDDDVPF